MDNVPPEFETEGTCPSGMVHERGQGCVEPLGVPECTQGYDCPGDPAGPDRTETHPSKCEPGIQSCEWGCVAGMNCEGDPLNPVDTCDPDIQTCGVANPNQGHECERQPTRVEQEECIGSCHYSSSRTYRILWPFNRGTSSCWWM